MFRHEQGTLRAFAQALIPEGGKLPGAETPDGVAVVSQLERVVATAGPRVRIATRLAINAFEWTTFPRRFSRLPLERRAQHLDRIGAGGSRIGRELFSVLKGLTSLAYGNDPSVQEGVGVKLSCERAGETRPSPVPPLRAGALEPPQGGESCDVVIVGSGAGGAAVARVVAEAGLDAIVVEQGDYHDASDYSTDVFESADALYRDGGLTVCEGTPAIPMPIGQCVGGTTVINSGTCFHAPGDVLVRWRDEHGIDWATDLDRHFEQLDRDLDVRPVDPATAGRNAQLCRAGAEAIGASNGPIARNAGNVICCGSCPSGCALDAKQAMHVSELPRAVAAGARIRAGAKVDRVCFEGRRATGVRCTTAAGPYEVSAKAVVLAAGALGTPELLLRQGVADLSGQIGRNLRVHPATWVGARYEEPVHGWDGVMQSWYVDEWHDRGLFLEATFTPFAFGLHWLPGSGQAFKRQIEDYGDIGIVGVHMSERESGGRVSVTHGGHTRISYRLASHDARQIGFGIARAAEMHLAAGATEVFPQIAGFPSISSAAGVGALDGAAVAPADLHLQAFHPLGTMRMGADRSTSVVAPNGESHELERLYVADAGIFPTSLGVNPMITIMACARHVATRLAERLS